MNSQKKKETFEDITNLEFTANNYVLKCFTVTMLIFTLTFFLNLIGVFIVEKGLMLRGFGFSCIVYFATLFLAKFVLAGSKYLKYVILFSAIAVLTIMGVFLTYHVMLLSLLPFLYATLYTSKPVMRFVYFMMVVSTFIVVYGGFYFGLCDANMALLTATKTQDYIVNGKFTLTEINSNPQLTLFLFFVLPRCLVYIVYVSICNSIYNILHTTLEKARISSEMETAKIHAENANRAKTQFLVKMSHEIRTPINAVLGMDEMILRESNEEPIKQYASDIKQSSFMLLNIINDILDASKIESGMMEIVPADYEFGSMINDLYNLMYMKTKEKNLKLTFCIDPSTPKRLYGDDKRIKQVLVNLLSNAIKYTDGGEVALHVDCTIDGRIAYLHFTVKDTGIGIKQEDIGKIYDAYQRFDMQRNRNVEGTGLGMNIVQELLRLMDSEIKIESEFNQGSEFSFLITQDIMEESPIGEFNNHFRTSADEVYENNYTAPNASVLVVDDFEMNLKVFKGLLKPTKIRVSVAESGKECLELMRKNHYDIVFLDHMMPDMDGIETLKEIKKQKLCEGTPIVMLTANAIVGDREKFIKEGFDDFVTKPILVEKLDKVIMQYLPKKLLIMQDGGQTRTLQITETEAVINDTITDELDIDRNVGLATCGGDMEFYKELLEDFTKMSIKEELKTCLEKNDSKRYCVRVHGFKSSAYSIGAKRLGDLAYEIEKSTKEGFPEEIADLQEQLFKMYDLMCVKCNELREA